MIEPLTTDFMQKTQKKPIQRDRLKAFIYK